MTAIILNNRVYGMTGGQFSPLSGFGVQSTTSPYSNIDQAFDVVEMARAGGATFVARTTAYHVMEICEFIKRAIRHKGFSVVEILSQCPTHFGRKNKLGDAVEMLEHLKENTTKIDSRANQPELLQRGVFVEKDLPEYCREYDKIIARATQG